MCNFALVLLAFIFSGLSACQSSGNNHNANPNNKSIYTWELIESGQHCTIETPKQVIINTQENFNALWNETFTGIDPQPTQPQINFTQTSVIAFYAGEQRSGGHALSIQSITSDVNNNATIVILHQKPAANCMTAAVISYPFLMATVSPKVDMASFSVTTKEMPCN